ncbi:ENTH domain-containing protein 1 [Ctenodactylus gundi]
MAFRRRVKNFVKNYSDAEIKVREATSNDPWGPSSSLMLDISDLTFNAISLSEIMNMLWQRLSDHGKNWRHVYKSLTLMDYLIKHGSKKFIQHCREGLFNLQVLKDFQHIDEAGKDQGYYIREKSKQVITLLMNKQLLYKARKVAYRTRRRTSCSLLFPKRLPATGNSPAARASALTPETPASEKERKLLKVSSLRDKGVNYVAPTWKHRLPPMETARGSSALGATRAGLQGAHPPQHEAGGRQCHPPPNIRDVKAPGNEGGPSPLRGLGSSRREQPLELDVPSSNPHLTANRSNLLSMSPVPGQDNACFPGHFEVLEASWQLQQLPLCQRGLLPERGQLKLVGINCPWYSA